MKNFYPIEQKKEAPISGRDFIYNFYTLLNLLKTNAVGPANVFSSTTQGPVEVSYV